MPDLDALERAAREAHESGDSGNISDALRDILEIFPTLTAGVRRLCQVEDEVRDGACDDCGAEHTAIYRSGYGAWFCLGCLIDNAASAIEDL
jgi:hypothetical protein